MPTVRISISVICGLIAGALACYVYKVGVFCLGCIIGWVSPMNLILFCLCFVSIFNMKSMTKKLECWIFLFLTSIFLQYYRFTQSTFTIIKSILRALQVKYFSKINVRKDGNSECNDKDLFWNVTQCCFATCWLVLISLVLGYYVMFIILSQALSIVLVALWVSKHLSR